MSKSTIAAIVALIGGLIQFSGGIDWPTPKPPVIADVLGGCYVADRASTVRIVTEMAGREFSDDAEQADWFNSEAADARAGDFQPFISLLAEAIEGGTLVEFARSLK